MQGKINLESELKKERQKSRNPSADLMKGINDLFISEWENEQDITFRLQSKNNPDYTLDTTGWDKDKIYGLKEIKSLCIKFRLRFLDTKYFKGDIPYEAIAEIKRIEKEKDIKIKNFSIIAPSEVFELEDANKDPLLFIPLSDEKYYLVHKWGNDLSWQRKILFYPLRNIASLIISLMLVSGLFTLLIPAPFLSPLAETTVISFIVKFLFFIWFTVFLCAITSFFWFATNRELSSGQWNSPYFN